MKFYAVCFDEIIAVNDLRLRGYEFLAGRYTIRGWMSGVSGQW